MPMAIVANGGSQGLLIQGVVSIITEPPMTAFSVSRLVALTLTPIWIAAACGCASLKPAATPDQSVDSLLRQAPPTYNVALYGTGSEPDVETLPLVEGTTVQDALLAVKAHKRYWGMEITVVRRVGDNGPYVRMPSTYKRSARSVLASENYALHPNDRVEIRPFDQNVLDAAMTRMINATTLFR
jgi:hypothetical protein